jgi:predicted DCC family thiol-disulfide oxidoreductase YuxK/uncharacterized membrane protein YphA (DoxX/SURF4 family)
MKPTRQILHGFWFEAAPPARLAVLRVLVGMFALWYAGTGQDDLVKVVRTDPKLFAPVGLVFGGPPSLQLFHWIHRGVIVGALFFTLGLWYRLSAPLFAALLLWLLCFRNSWSMIYHSDNLFALHVIVLAATRAADAYSLDALLRRRRQPGHVAAREPRWQYGWPIKLMCAVTGAAYFVTAVAKLAGPLGLSWMTGEALRSQMAVDALRKELLGLPPNPVSYALYDWLGLFGFLAVGSFALEFFAPLALLNKRLGRAWAVGTFCMHWGILFVMHITFRYHLSGVLFAPFFRVERALELPRKLWRRRAAAVSEESLPESAAGLATRPGLQRATLYFDGECGLCDRFVQFVLRHDRSEYFQFAPLQSESGREQLARLGLPEDNLRTVVLVEDGKSYVRSTATLRVCRRLAGLWPLLYALILIPKQWRDGAYALIARNRKRWFKSGHGCPVMPPEWRRRFIG